MKKYYKVVTFDLQSCSVVKLAVQYNLNTEIKPKNNSKLFVFDKLLRAKQFRANYGGHIYSCHVTNPTKPVNFMPNFMPNMYYHNSKFWSLYRKAKKQKRDASKVIYKNASKLKLSYNRWPEGTIWVDSVTLLKNVQ